MRFDDRWTDNFHKPCTCCFRGIGGLFERQRIGSPQGDFLLWSDRRPYRSRSEAMYHQDRQRDARAEQGLVYHCEKQEQWSIVISPYRVQGNGAKLLKQTKQNYEPSPIVREVGSCTTSAVDKTDPGDVETFEKAFQVLMKKHVSHNNKSLCIIWLKEKKGTLIVEYGKKN